MYETQSEKHNWKWSTNWWRIKSADLNQYCDLLLNPNSKTEEKVLASFDIGSQLSFISKDLATRLKLPNLKNEVLNLASFGNKISNHVLHAKSKYA